MRADAPRAELIAVGSELLVGRADANGDWLARRLTDLGFVVGGRCLVGDDEDAIAAAIAAAAVRADLLVLTGGLGPTDDDRTREALARACARPLVRDAAAVDWLRAWAGRRGRDAGEPGIVRQALVPQGGAALENPRGSAPGIDVRCRRARIVALPGVPGEMRPMFEGLAHRLAAGTVAPARARLLVAGRRESEVDGELGAWSATSGLDVTVLASSGLVEVLFSASGSAEGEALVRRALAATRETLGADVVADGDGSLAGAVADRLRAAGQTLAVAESCTAGMLAAELTREAGASDWFLGGLIVYADGVKRALAGVPPAMLARHGAVSRKVVEHLAESARKRCDADWGVAISGIAGPGGGSAAKPVGLVWIGVAAADRVHACEFRFHGDRDGIRRLAVTGALDSLRRRLVAT